MNRGSFARRMTGRFNEDAAHESTLRHAKETCGSELSRARRERPRLGASWCRGGVRLSRQPSCRSLFLPTPVNAIHVSGPTHNRFFSAMVFRLLLLLAVANLLTGCDRKTSEQTTSGQAKSRLFAVSFMTLNNPFFVDLGDGIRGVVEARGDRLLVLDAQFNALKQKNDISDVLQQSPAAIFINPVNWEGVRATLLDAQRRKVPIIVVDTQVADDSLVLTQVASDNVAAGRL